MSFDRIYLDEDEKVKALQDFASGNRFSLFKAMFSSLSGQYRLLEDNSFVLNLFQTLNHQEKQEFLEYYMESGYYSDKNYFVQDAQILKKIEHFWYKDIPNPMPFFMTLIPFLDDEGCVKLLNNVSFYSLEENEEYPHKTLLQNVFTTFFDKGMVKSIEALTDNYSVSYKFSLSDFTDVYSIGDKQAYSFESLFEEFTNKNYHLIKPLSKMNHYGVEYASLNWFEKQLYEPTIDKNKLKSFLNDYLLSFSEETQEKFIALTLKNTDKLDLLKHALSLKSIDKLREYKPTITPLWAHVAEHKDKKIFKRLLRVGIDLFDFHEEYKTFFIEKLMTQDSLYNFRSVKDILNNHNLDIHQVYKKIFKSFTSKEGNTDNYYSVLASQDNYTLNTFININLTVFDSLEFLDNRFKNKTYNELPTEEKFAAINRIIDSVFFKPVFHYSPEGDSSYKKKKNTLVANMILSNISAYNTPDIWIFKEQLSLLGQMATHEDDIKKYRAHYFNILESLFGHYFMKDLSVDKPIFKTIQQMIDFVAIDKNLDWQGLEEKIHKQENQSNGFGLSPDSKELLSYLRNIILNYSLKAQLPDKKRLKI